MTAGCGAPAQTIDLPAGVDPSTQAVLQGRVVDSATAAPVGGAFVRLLDGTGEFTAEVVTSPEGVYRFFAAPGSWTVRALSRFGNGSTEVAVAERGVTEAEISVSR